MKEIERKEKSSENKKFYFGQLKDMASKREKEFHSMKIMDLMRSIVTFS